LLQEKKEGEDKDLARYPRVRTAQTEDDPMLEDSLLCKLV